MKESLEDVIVHNELGGGIWLYVDSTDEVIHPTPGNTQIRRYADPSYDHGVLITEKEPWGLIINDPVTLCELEANGITPQFALEPDAWTVARTRKSMGDELGEMLAPD